MKEKIKNIMIIVVLVSLVLTPILLVRITVKQKQAFLLSEYGIDAPFWVADQIDIRIDNNNVRISQ